jgi:hypothetical protein
MAKKKTQATKKRSQKSLQVDAELAAIRARVQRRREYLDLLETELTNTRGIILEFTELYNERVAPLEREQRRLSRLLEKWALDLEPPANGWRGRGKRPPKQANPNRHHGQQAQETIEKRKRVQKLDPDYERKVRDLFRRLAKQYHPDLAQKGEDKKLFEKVMSEINQAYTAKDLKALEALAQAHGLNSRGHSRLPSAELARLKLELRQLDAMIFEVEQTIRELDLSPAMQMRGDTNDGRPHRRDILREMETDYHTRIDDLREQLMGLGLDEEVINGK